MSDAFGIPKEPAVPSRSLAMHQAATNLLDKAVLALEDGQIDRARGYVRRAARLPYDDDAAAAPLALAAHMYAVRSVLDAYEAAGGGWLDAAEVLLHPLPSRNPLAVADFRHVLTVVQQDYATTRAQDERLHSLIAGQKVATIREMQELAGEELCAVVIDLLEIVLDYQDKVDALRGGRETGD